MVLYFLENTTFDSHLLIVNIYKGNMSNPSSSEILAQLHKVKQNPKTHVFILEQTAKDPNYMLTVVNELLPTSYEQSIFSASCLVLHIILTRHIDVISPQLVTETKELIFRKAETQQEEHYPNTIALISDVFPFSELTDFVDKWIRVGKIHLAEACAREITITHNHEQLIRNILPFIENVDQKTRICALRLLVNVIRGSEKAVLIDLAELLFDLLLGMLTKAAEIERKKPLNVFSEAYEFEQDIVLGAICNLCQQLGPDLISYRARLLSQLKATRKNARASLEENIWVTMDCISNVIRLEQLTKQEINEMIQELIENQKSGRSHFVEQWKKLFKFMQKDFAPFIDHAVPFFSEILVNEPRGDDGDELFDAGMNHKIACLKVLDRLYDTFDTEMNKHTEAIAVALSKLLRKYAYISICAFTTRILPKLFSKLDGVISNRLDKAIRKIVVITFALMKEEKDLQFLDIIFQCLGDVIPQIASRLRVEELMNAIETIRQMTYAGSSQLQQDDNNPDVMDMLEGLLSIVSVLSQHCPQFPTIYLANMLEVFQMLRYPGGTPVTLLYETRSMGVVLNTKYEIEIQLAIKAVTPLAMYARYGEAKAKKIACEVMVSSSLVRDDKYKTLMYKACTSMASEGNKDALERFNQALPNFELDHEQFLAVSDHSESSSDNESSSSEEEQVKRTNKRRTVVARRKGRK
jgi:hypothetical protein